MLPGPLHAALGIMKVQENLREGSRMRSVGLAVVAAGLALICSIATFCQAQGVGAILKEDCPTFSSSKADKPEYSLKAGTYFAFYKGLTWGDYKSDNGFIRVAFFEDNDQGQEKFTWVAEDKLEFFFYPCAEGSSGFSSRSKTCVPVQVRGFHHQWNLEFKVSAMNKCKELKITPPKQAILPPTAKAPEAPVPASPEGK
jgi:hypothetical protein